MPYNEKIYANNTKNLKFRYTAFLKLIKKSITEQWGFVNVVSIETTRVPMMKVYCYIVGPQ